MALNLPPNPVVGQKWPTVNPSHICVHANGPSSRWRLYAAGVEAGTPGTPGTQIRSGDGPPDNAVGLNGDIHINRINGDWYTRVAGVYVFQFNAKGPPGTPGSGGSGGVFQLETGGAPGSELAPAVNAYTTYSTGITAGSDHLIFNAVANLGAAIKTGMALVDNMVLDCQLEIFEYVQGGCQLLAYGNTTGHLGQSAVYTANGTYQFQLTLNGATGTQLAQIRLRASGSGTHTFKARLSVKEAGAASVYPARTFDIVVREKTLSVCNAGVTPENTAAQNYAAWTALVQTYGRRKWEFPEGEFDFTSLPIYWDAVIEGHGRNYSIINITGTGNIHGCDVRGIGTFDRSMQVVLSGFTLRKTGGAQTTAGSGPGQNNWAGLYCRTKCDTNDITIDGFTNDGFYFAPWDANEATGAGGTIDRAPFFSKHAGLVVKNCGRDGLAVRRGANAHEFRQSQFISNGRYGLNHYTDGYATYSNEFRVGQASYNGSVGWNFNNGTNTVTSQIYAEQNGCSSPGNNGTAYATTQFDYAIGNNCTDSWFGLGALFGNDETTKQSHVSLPTFNPTRIKVLEGARVRFGSW